MDIKGRDNEGGGCELDAYKALSSTPLPRTANLSICPLTLPIVLLDCQRASLVEEGVYTLSSANLIEISPIL